MKDSVVIGGGPAGLTAALYLARFLRSVTVFDTQDGRARLIPTTHNIGPFPDGVSGLDLLDRMRTHGESYGARIEVGEVRRVEKQGASFLVETDRRTEAARSVVFASGVFNHRPPLSRPEHDLGLARGLIRYCPVCDAYEVRGKRVAVLGNDLHGFGEAVFLRRYSSMVTLIPPDGSQAVARNGIAALDAPMRTISLTESDVIVTSDRGTLSRFDTLYVALGTTARSDVASRLGVDLTDSRHIAVDAKHRTNIDGAYAIGDVTEGLDQIAVAMGQAAVAATAIHRALSTTPA
jgi:thioredoxin reductase (NADPH)